MAEAKAENDELRGQDAATDDLLDSFEEIDRISCEDVADTGSLPVEWIPKLEKISSAQDAPKEFQVIGGKVATGQLTWEEFYDDPGAQDGGIELFNALNKELGFDLTIPDLTE